jgi:hypothetical protein
MRVELPEGYVPPEPTHPQYGYLTPEEQEAFEAEERARLGIVPGVVEETEAGEAEESAAPEPAAPEPTRSEPAALGVVGDYRWDAYQQAWAAAAAPPPTAVPSEEPLPDVAAPAGGRGAASSWTTADGQRHRRDARAQQWVTEPSEPPT